MGWRARLLGSMLVLGVVSRAQAAAPERARFEYHAAEGCPGEFTFRSQVQARSTGWLLEAAVDDAGAALPRLVVLLAKGDRGYQGKLQIWRGAQPTESALEAPTCDEVVAGLAIAAALDAKERADAEEARARLAPSAPAPAPPPVASAPAGRAPEVDVRRRSPSFWALQAAAKMRFGYGPGSALGAAVGVVRRSASLSWGLHASGTWARDVTSEQLALSLAYYDVEAHVCPLVLRARTYAWLLGCVVVESGVVRAHASSDETTLRPWLAPGASLRVMGRFSSLLVEPSLSVSAPLVRDRYWFRPNQEAFRTPALVAEVGLSLGVAL